MIMIRRRDLPCHSQIRLKGIIILLFIVVIAWSEKEVVDSNLVNVDTLLHKKPLRLPHFFADDMVLQRDGSSVFGDATPMSTVTLRITRMIDNLQTFVTNASVDHHGKWSIYFTYPGSVTPFYLSLEINDQSSSRIEFRNVVFGDVFLCSGQSNMEFNFASAFESQDYIPTTKDLKSESWKGIRFLTMNHFRFPIPVHDAFAKTLKPWLLPTPVAFSNVFESYPSAVCAFFGLEYVKANDLPVGLISSSWGGQLIEAFSSKEALEDKTCGGVDLSSFIKFPHSPMERKIPTVGNVGPKAIWNGMIAPLSKLKISGVLWYQGEQNVNDPNEYACRLPAMISDWRLKFDIPWLPFVFVQLSGMPNYWDFYEFPLYPRFRIAQSSALALHNVRMVVTLDLGQIDNAPFSPIHPQRKREIGRRLSLSMSRILSQIRGFDDLGPLPISVKHSFSSQEQNFTLEFIKETILDGGGIHFAKTPDCKACCNESPFEIRYAADQDADTWYRVPFMLNENRTTVLLRLPGLPLEHEKIAYIRYAFKPYPECLMYNGIGDADSHNALPSPPFIYDTNLQKFHGLGH